MRNKPIRWLVPLVLLAIPLLYAFAPLFAPKTLTVMSQSPNSGVPITVWTADLQGLKNGTTTFTRSYDETAIVKITAPATAGDNVFSHWEGDEQIIGTTKTVSLRMLSDRVVSAVYVPKRTLTITSFNPASGVPITVYQADLNLQKNGDTTFTRVYKLGTQVSVNAPPIVNGTQHFDRWNKNGVALTNSRTATVQMSANTTLSAVYKTGALLTITSQNPDTGVPITVYQADKAGLKNGTTAFTRLYGVGTNVSMTAPATAGDKTFVRWEKDGVPVPGTSRTISVLMNSNRTVKAVYGP